MKLESLQELFIDELKDLYSAENQIVRALPKMAKAANSPELKAGFEEHLRQTEEHVARIEQICDDLGTSPKGKACKGMSGLIEEGSELMEENATPEVMDAALILAAQKVEHYEMAGYGTCLAYAKQLGNIRAADFLNQTLKEEKQTDEKLSELALSFINAQAAEKAVQSAGARA